MLDSEEEEGMIWINPIFGTIIADNEGEGAIFCSIYDCSCEECDALRGGIEINKTIVISLPIDDEVLIVQRLTVQEATLLGQALITYAKDLKILMEEEI